MKSLLAAIPLFLVSLTACLAQTAPFSFKESYDLGASTKVMISSSDGNIDVVGFEGTKTDVFYIVKKNNRMLNISRQELEKELDLDVTQAGNSLSIVVKYKNEFGWVDWKDKLIVSFRLQVPKGTACDLRTSDGNISMKGLTKDQHCKTSDGNLEIFDIGGMVEGSTSDGDITARKIGGPIDLKTSDGNIKVEDIKGEVRASTSDGNVVAANVWGDTFAKTSDGDISFKDLTGSLTASTSDGNVTGNLLKLTKELRIKTSDGNIDVTIPDKLGLDLDIKGESLDVPLTNFSGHSDEKSIQGKMQRWRYRSPPVHLR